jgi:hypothetical protein
LRLENPCCKRFVDVYFFYKLLTINKLHWWRRRESSSITSFVCVTYRFQKTDKTQKSTIPRVIVQLSYSRCTKSCEVFRPPDSRPHHIARLSTCSYIIKWTPTCWSVTKQPLKREWFFEERNGNARLMAPLTERLSETALIWARAVAPVAEWCCFACRSHKYEN